MTVPYDRPFARAGAWAGEVWACNCKGRAHQGYEARCLACGIARPSLRFWMRQTMAWGRRLRTERVERARSYVQSVVISAIMREGSDWILDGANPIRILEEETAKRYDVTIAEMYPQRLENTRSP